MRPRGRTARRAMWLTSAMLCLVAACMAEPCGPGTKDVRGTVIDGSGAPIAGAVLTAGTVTTKSSPEGQFLLPCVADQAVIRVEAASFATAEVKADVAARVVLAPLAAHEEISVTAYRTPLAESASPASVRLVTGEELRTAAPVTLDDRLRQVTGFELFRRSSSLVANPTSQGVSLRGLGSTAASRTLVLANEIPL
ncbi:MAG TPA: carboxypeptidase regulatory-like domain-containing protein, partial [Terracidiphilus sp.]|nr:carboxypeptidase regulatory-like domain-containing protein [Terracidiphilus sp.]